MGYTCRPILRQIINSLYFCNTHCWRTYYKVFCCCRFVYFLVRVTNSVIFLLYIDVHDDRITGSAVIFCSHLVLLGSLTAKNINSGRVWSLGVFTYYVLRIVSFIITATGWHCISGKNSGQQVSEMVVVLTVRCNADQFLRASWWNARLLNLSLSMSNEIGRLMIIQLECYLNAVTDMNEYSCGRTCVIQVQCIA